MPYNNSLAITVDIEDWYHIPSVCGSPFSIFKDTDEFFDKWIENYDYLTKPTHRVLDLLRQFGIKATFFIVADVTQHYPGLVDAIMEEGHEIACHGLDHSCTIHPKTKQPLLSQEQFEADTLHAKQILEKQFGGKVIGYRAPNALIGGWMIDTLERLGFTYDSSVSVNSLYNKTDSSLRNVSSSPYHPLTGNLEPGGSDNFIEYPWAYWDILGWKVPTSGGPMLRFLGSHVILKGLKQSLKRGDTIFYFHPLDIAQEKFPNIGRKRPLYWIIRGKVVEKRIKHIIGVLKEMNIQMKPIMDISE